MYVMLSVREIWNSNLERNPAVLQKLSSDGTFNGNLCLSKE